MKKLLHERLREYGSNCRADYTDWLSQRHANELANEIEKYYIPRPRFEDGEPVQSSDMEEIGGLATCRVYTDGSWIFDPDKYEDERNPKPWDEQQGRQCDFIKRPEPKVLDADGVEIKVGDKVYLVPGKHCNSFPLCYYMAGVEYTVVENESIGHKASGRICISRGDSVLGFPMPEQVTHRDPDSLEKLREDMQKSYDISGVIVLGRYLDRLTAIMERDEDGN